MATERRSVIIGCGGYLPENLVTNHDLAQKVDTSDEWIVERSGIKQRYFAASQQKTSDLALKAAEKAILNAGITAQDIDLIILATATPDNTFPATAAKVQGMLGIKKGFAFDVQAVCSGFIYALACADNFLRLGQANCALVIGAETFSRILDWNDRGTCVLFGDGAGAVVLKASENTERGILSTHLHSDGKHYDLLYVDGGPSSGQNVGYLKMEGKEVFKHAVVNLAQVVDEALAANDMGPDAIDWLVPHQANRRILDATAKRLNLPPEKVVVTVDQHANTSAASIPLALYTAVEDGRIKPGQVLLLNAMGGGFTWGSALIRF